MENSVLYPQTVLLKYSILLITHIRHRHGVGNKSRQHRNLQDDHVRGLLLAPVSVTQPQTLCSSGVLGVWPEAVADFYSHRRQLQRDFVFLSVTLWFCLHEENVNGGRSWNVVVKRNLGRR